MKNIFYSILTQFALAKCPRETGLPLAVGSRVIDGTTEVNMWNEVIGGVFIIGATTFSDAVSSTSGACKDGCGLLASWDKSQSEFLQRYIFLHTKGVASLSTNKDTTAVIFDGNDGQVISFLKWSGTKKPRFEVGESGYVHKYPVSGTTLSLMRRNWLHMIVNDPNLMVTRDFFFKVQNA